MTNHLWEGNICLRCGCDAALGADWSCREPKLYAYDTETHLIQPGLLAPPLVIGSVADSTPGSERILSKDEARQTFSRLIQAEHIGGANIPYDLGVHCADDPTLTEHVFKALDEDRVHDTHLLEPLHDNARGCLFKDPLNGVEFKRYSLAMLEQRYLGIDRTEEKKGENAWRLRYAELDGLPLSEFPPEAVEYPRHDARGTFDVLSRQLAGTLTPSTGDERFNVGIEGHEVRAAWALHLACLWGFRTDAELVKVVVADILKKSEENHRKFFSLGLVKVRRCAWKTKEFNGEKVKERETSDDISAADVHGYLNQLALVIQESEADDEPAPEWVRERVKELSKALRDIEKFEPVRYAEDKGRLKELVTAAYGGNPPMTAGGESGDNPQVSTSRDTLAESGNEDLEAYAEAGPNKKLKSTYVDVLEQGVRVPINPQANAFIATDRTSYREPNLQQLPRKGMVRECFIPREWWPE